MHIKFRCKESPLFWVGLLIISTDLFWHLGPENPNQVDNWIQNVNMKKHETWSHICDIICCDIHIYWFTKFTGVSLKDLWNFNVEVEIFTLVSVLFIPCSATFLCVFKFTWWFLLNNRFLNTPTDELRLNLTLCLTGFPIVTIIPVPFLLTKNKMTTLCSI